MRVPGRRSPLAGATGTTEELDEAVAKARHGDEQAFGQVFRAAHPGLLRYLRVLVGADAEDVASETWLQVARDFRSFSGDWVSFRGWAVTIARHRAIDHARRQRRRCDVSIPVEEFADRPAPDDTAGAALSAVSTDLAIALIATLPPEQAEAIMLRVVVGLDARTCGRILGRRAGTVRTAAHRGLRELARRLEQDDQSNPQYQDPQHEDPQHQAPQRQGPETTAPDHLGTAATRSEDVAQIQ